ncbi:vacuolar fusion protein CCZ1 homolog isoform X2 [Culicoides brevitarsis]|uniref:vacuolar fusion protein CCZ1 homolog isoform X2 n=1 Tax=Culicoides brevitarsis TaxID=469753 RepID=UPI00307CC057
MSSRTDVTVKNLIVFNSRLGSKEGENEELDKKIKNVGLCEAIIKFTSAFTSNSDVKNVITQKTVQIYFQPETEFWMIFTLYVPYNVKLKLNQEQIDYRNDDAHIYVYYHMIQQIYASFKLLHGTLLSNFRGNTLTAQQENLSAVLDKFFNTFSINNYPKSTEIFNIFHSVNYFAVDKLNFLRHQAFSNMIKSTFSDIDYSIFLFRQKILWSSLSSETLFNFYEYLKRERFLKREKENTTIWIDGVRYIVLIYKTVNCINCHFVKCNKNGRENLFKDLCTFMDAQVIKIEIDLENLKKSFPQEKLDAIYKHIFLNELTYKHESSLSNLLKDSTIIPLDITNILADMFEYESESSVELVVKTHNDFWIIQKTTNCRHYFLVTCKSTSTLIEITEEATHLMKNHIRNIFFF